MKLISQFKQDASKKAKVRIIAGVALLVGILLLLFFFNPNRQHTRRPHSHTEPIVRKKEDLLKESWLSQASAQLEAQNRQIEQLKRELKELKNMKKNQEADSSSSKSKKEAFPKHLSTSQQPQNPGQLPYRYPPPPHNTFHRAPQPAPQGPQAASTSVVDYIAVVKGSESEKQGAGNKQLSPSESSKTSVQKEEKKKKSLETINNTISAGSFTTGVLLSGLDAPTGGHASSSPHPVLIRLTDLTIMPNKFQSDLKSCFVIGEGYGDLSSERVYIKLNTLSCVRTDGTILQKSITGYVTGEDGKIGLKGRVVSKQGTLLARSLIAGFLQGAANILQQQSTTVSISPLGSTQSLKSSEAGRVALYSGAATAAEKLADFYMKLVKQEFPVIEINAGRKVDVVFLKKVKLED